MKRCCKIKFEKDRPLAQLLSAYAIGGKSLGIKSRAGQIGAVSAQIGATAATFLRSCVALALSRGDGSRHSLHVSA